MSLLILIKEKSLFFHLSPISHIKVYTTRMNRLTKLISEKDIKKFVTKCHNSNMEAWIAGSITISELPILWNTGVDVICIRGAATISYCSNDRFGNVKACIVKRLVSTIPSSLVIRN